MDRSTLQKKNTTTPQAMLYVALELSQKEWKLAFSDGGQRVRTVTVAGDERVSALVRAAGLAKAKFGLPAEARVVSCYEAGRDGFWIHRQLVEAGIGNVVVDPASIEVDRRLRRAKTDRMDARKLVGQLVRHVERGDRMREVRVPTCEEEDARRPVRELERLQKERRQHVTRIRALLALHGLAPKKLGRTFDMELETMKSPSGQDLPGHLVAEMKREWERLGVVQRQMKQLEKARDLTVKAKGTKAAQMAATLALLKGIGVTSGAVFSYEFFSWREFKNGKEVGSSAGMTGTPYNSGSSTREQGISKAGNSRVRFVAVEVAWQWLRYQPQSKLAKWYEERFAHGSTRSRRIGIVALARKLLVALWRYVEHGVVPEGAEMKPAM